MRAQNCRHLLGITEKAVHLLDDAYLEPLPHSFLSGSKLEYNHKNGPLLKAFAGFSMKSFTFYRCRHRATAENRRCGTNKGKIQPIVPACSACFAEIKETAGSFKCTRQPDNQPNTSN